MNKKITLSVIEKLQELTIKYMPDKSYISTSIEKDKLSGTIEFDCGMMEVYYDYESGSVLIDRDFY